MEVFMTGATGYIGSAVADKLLKKGYLVSGPARSEASAAQLSHLGVRPVRTDLSDHEGLYQAARSADAVVHAAFEFAPDIAHAVAGEQAAVSALLKSSKPLLYTSGTAVLGDTGTAIFTEASHIPDHPFRGRFATEQMVLDAGGIVIRPPNVYGRGHGHGLLSALAGIAQQQGYVPLATNSENNLWSFVHIEDLSDLYTLALQHSPKGQLYHAGAESGLRTEDIARTLSKGGRIQALPLSQLRSIFPVPALADYWATNNQSSREKAEQMLGWKPSFLNLPGSLGNIPLPA